MPPEVLDEIRARVDLVDLVGAVVPLKRAGERGRASCPFHQRRRRPSPSTRRRASSTASAAAPAATPSSSCASRTASTSPRPSAPLAQRVGVALPTRGRRARQRAALEGLRARDGAGRAHESEAPDLWATPTRERAARLPRRVAGSIPTWRGASASAMRPEGWDHLLGAQRARTGMGAEALLAPGRSVLRARTAAGFYDRFRGRLIFPIARHAGPRDRLRRPRARPGEEPKYI